MSGGGAFSGVVRGALRLKGGETLAQAVPHKKHHKRKRERAAEADPAAAKASSGSEKPKPAEAEAAAAARTGGEDAAAGNARDESAAKKVKSEAADGARLALSQEVLEQRMAEERAKQRSFVQDAAREREAIRAQLEARAVGAAGPAAAAADPRFYIFHGRGAADAREDSASFRLNQRAKLKSDKFCK
jgi:hypothetical protein